MKLFNSTENYCRLLSIATLFISSSLFAQEQKMPPTLQQHLNDVTQLVQNQWPLMNKVWPNLDYTSINLLIISINHETPSPGYWIVNVNGLRQVTANDVGNPPQPEVENYAIHKILGKNGVIITIDSKKPPKTAEDTFRLATHELVHGWFQTEIKIAENNNSRNTQYPLDYRPRLYRFMIIRSLQQAVRYPQTSSHLCDAKYWFNKWKSEYNNEYQQIKTTDIAEGSASFIENMAVFVEKNKSLTQIRDKILPIFNISPKQESSLDGESYPLGDVAGVLLDTFQPQWKKTFYQNNTPPAELLLNKIPNCHIDGATSPFEKIFQQKINTENQRLSTLFLDIDKVLNTPDIPFLRLDSRYQQGSMSGNGFYDYKGHTVIPQMTAQFKGKTWEVRVMKMNVLDTSSSFLIPLVPPVTLKNNTLNLDTPMLKGKVKVKPERDKNNRIIYVPIDDR